MRAQLRDQEGAVAVIVAILTVVLVGIAAFVTDFGLAYANKRNLQKSADAAALAAASAVISNLTGPTENCASVASRFQNNTGGLATALQTVADSIATQNTPQSVRTAMTVTCSSDGRRVEVSYTNSGTTTAIFGGIFDQGDITAVRTATADVFTRDSGFGLRPYAVCTLDRDRLTAATSGTNKWVRIDYPNEACGNYSGNWYTLDCPDDGNNGTLDENTRNGCNSEVGIVDDAPLTALQADIMAECTAAKDDNWVPPNECLLSNPGNLASETLTDAWDYVMTLPAVTVPIFAPDSNAYAAANVNRCGTGGNNGCYPVRALASVKVCAYRFQNKTPDTVSGDPLCAGLTIDEVEAGPNIDTLWLALTRPVQTSGSTGPGSGSVGNGSNVLGTRLIQ